VGSAGLRRQKPFPFLKTPYDERDGQFSADGKWIAYQSNASGRYEVYVQPFPGPGEKVQISSNGGAQPRWNKNGKEIFYVSLDSQMMAAPVKLSPRWSVAGNRDSGGPLPGSHCRRPHTRRQQAAIRRVFGWPAVPGQSRRGLGPTRHTHLQLETQAMTLLRSQELRAWHWQRPRQDPPRILSFCMSANRRREFMLVLGMDNLRFRGYISE